MTPLLSWDGKKRQLIIGPSAVALLLGLAHAGLAALGANVPAAIWKSLAVLWK